MIKWMKETDELKDLNPTEFVGQTASVQVGGNRSLGFNLAINICLEFKCFMKFSGFT